MPEDNGLRKTMDLFNSALRHSLAGSAKLTDWQRDVARGIAAAHPLTPASRIRARGNHLAAQNDEPERTADRLQWSFDQVHLLRLESQPNSERFKALSEVLEVLRAARSQ